MTAGTIHIGTSGWHYKHWKGAFYPQDLKDADQLGFYTQQFNTVEINNSYYRVPSEATFQKWQATVPDNFLFAVKANRYLTHLKKLQDVRQTAADFIQRASRLGKKLGPVLFQLPPNWNINTETLANFMDALPAGHRYAFEFRNASWYDDHVYQILHDHNCAFCIYQLAGHLSPLQLTADFVYVRLHGPGGKYQGSYTEAALAEWAEHAQSWQQSGKTVFFYFDNDQQAHAVANAKTLIAMTSVK